jgi:hypothetical protein
MSNQLVEVVEVSFINSAWQAIDVLQVLAGVDLRGEQTAGTHLGVEFKGGE